jgi:hypothetical protein
LRLEFPSLFRISSDTKVVIMDYWEGAGWNINLGSDDVLQLERLINLACWMTIF